jgi:hypothetical protein
MPGVTAWCPEGNFGLVSSVTPPGEEMPSGLACALRLSVEGSYALRAQVHSYKDSPFVASAAQPGLHLTRGFGDFSIECQMTYPLPFLSPSHLPPIPSVDLQGSGKSGIIAALGDFWDKLIKKEGASGPGKSGSESWLWLSQATGWEWAWLPSLGFSVNNLRVQTPTYRMSKKNTWV